MRALDTSVTVALLAAWHEAHEVVTRAVRPDDRLPEHVALETYAVLTRLPFPLRLPAAVAVDVLQRRFPPPYLALPAADRDVLLARLAAADVTGGATYDGLVGLTALAHDVVLLSRDTRAAATYRRLGVATEQV